MVLEKDASVADIWPGQDQSRSASRKREGYPEVQPVRLKGTRQRYRGRRAAVTTASKPS